MTRRPHLRLTWLAAAVLFLVACAGGPAPTPIVIVTPAPTVAAATAVPTVSGAEPTPAASFEPIVFTETNGKTTKPFHIPTSIVTVNIVNEGGSCDFASASVTFYSADGTTVDFPFSVDGCDSDETEVRLDDGPGEYYVRIGVANTTVTITITPHD